MSPVGPVTATVSLADGDREAERAGLPRAGGLVAAERDAVSFELERAAGTARVYSVPGLAGEDDPGLLARADHPGLDRRHLAGPGVGHQLVRGREDRDPL